MSVRLMSAAWELEIPSTEKMVLMCLCDFASDDGSNCWPSIATIARKCSKSERTVQGAIRSLEEMGYLDTEERKGTSSAYQLDPRKICTPAKSAPPQKTSNTPAKSAPKPLRTTNKKKIPKKKTDMPCPEGVDRQTWRDALKHRDNIKHPMTPTALKGITTEAEKAGWTLEAALTEMVLRGWRGFKAEWVCENKKPANDGGGFMAHLSAKRRQA